MPSIRGRLPALAAILVAALFLTPGCGSFLTEGTSAGAGVAAAGIASAVTKNGSVTAAIGLGVQSVASVGLTRIERLVHRAEQDEIAAVAGTLPVGGIGHWEITHDIPIEDDERGQVSVSREIGAGELKCREIVFSVEHTAKTGLQQDFYVSSVCRDGDVWKWASAEPATSRWGTLQ